MHRLRKTGEMPINLNVKLAKSYASAQPPLLQFSTVKKRLVQTLLHHPNKLIKQIPAIMRTRRAFRMVLNREGGFVF